MRFCVALSRHREGSPHDGRDDFADRRTLARTFGRNCAKDMAGDYAIGEAPELSAALARHGRIVRSMCFSRSVGNSYFSEQRAELKASRAALENIRPQASLDLQSVFASKHRLIGEAASSHTQATLRVNAKCELILSSGPTRSQRW